MRKLIALLLIVLSSCSENEQKEQYCLIKTDGVLYEAMNVKKLPYKVGEKVYVFYSTNVKQWLIYPSPNAVTDTTCYLATVVNPLWKP